MKKWLLAAVGLAVVSAGGSAQDAKQGQEAKVAFEKKSYPYEGEVTVERLNVRMFPKADQVGIITSVLALGEKVTVVAEKDDYFQILPPKGSTVWVTAKNIKREGDKGVATANEIPVRLDSRVNADVLCTLKEGDSVKVSGEHMGWLKIEAPAAVKYYVGKKYVHAGKEIAEVPAPKTGGAKKGETAPIDGSDVEAKQLLASAEREFAKQSRLVNEGKVEQVDFSAVVADYEAAKAKAQSDGVRAEADRGLSRYRELNSIIQSAQVAIRIKEKELEEKRRAAAAAAAAKAAEIPPTLFQGYIESTGLLFKRPGTHKLVMNGRILCFLRCKEGDDKMVLRFNDNFQKYVGVNGPVIKNPDGWDGYSVVVVDELVPLQKD